MFRVGGNEILNGHHHGRDGAFHVGRATAIKQIAFLGGAERVVLPRCHIPRRDHVGVAGKGKYRSLRATAGPQVADLLEPEGFALETEGFQFFNHPVLAAFVLGGNGSAADEFLGVIEGAGHDDSSIGDSKPL